MIGMIAAVDPNGVIGVDNRIPWHYSADLKRFKRLTVGHTVVMGRNTYASIGKPLPRRANIVVTRRDFPDVLCVRSLEEALASADADREVWLIGGRGIYEAGLEVADLIDLTLVPDVVTAEDAVRFPDIDPARFEAGPIEPLPDDPRLGHQVWRRRR